MINERRTTRQLMDRLLDEVICPGLIPWVEQRLDIIYRHPEEVREWLLDRLPRPNSSTEKIDWDPQKILKVIIDIKDHSCFRTYFADDGYVQVGWVNELLLHGRNATYHGDDIRPEHVRRVADTAYYLLRSVKAHDHAEEARLISDEAARLKRHLEITRKLSKDLDDATTATIAAYLRRYNVPIHRAYVQAGLHTHRVVVDDIISLQNFSGEAGLTAAKLLVKFVPDATPELPDYVYEHWNNEGRDAEAKDQTAFVLDWHPAILDEGGKFHLILGPTYWQLSNVAMKKCAPRLHYEIVSHKLDILDQFPGYVSCGLTFVTTDRKLILLHRTKKVADEPNEWSVGIGTTMHYVEDDAPPYGLHPINTVIREMGRNEELGLDDPHTTIDEFSFLHLGLSVSNFAYTIFCHARLNVASEHIVQSVLSKAKDNEHKYGGVHVVEFDIDNCIDLLIDGSYVVGNETRKITSWSRLGLLYAALKEFGTEKILDKLASIP
jgi:hypothetical protein